jgi:hypothetical protein
MVNINAAEAAAQAAAAEDPDRFSSPHLFYVSNLAIKIKQRERNDSTLGFQYRKYEFHY